LTKAQKYYIIRKEKKIRKFDYERIFILGHGVPSQILEHFHTSLTGPNFIVNQKALVDAFWVTDRHKAEYLGICALRSYEDYHIRGMTDLQVSSVPSWVPLQIIEKNPLLKLTDNTIIFLKENIKDGN